MAINAVSSAHLDIGGMRYTAAPYSACHVAAQVANGTLASEQRFNVLPELARKMGLHTEVRPRIRVYIYRVYMYMPD